MKKRFLSLGLGVMSFVVVLPSISSLISLKAGESSLSLFAMNGGMKGKELESDGDSSKKGFLLYGYDNGASASFKTPLSSDFAADLKFVGDGLLSYTLTFSNNVNGQSFGVKVYNRGSFTEVAVSYLNQEAGLAYVKDNHRNDVLRGYTAGYNKAGSYTSLSSVEHRLLVDPHSLTLKAAGANGSYKTVWDFSSEYNDGRHLKNDLKSFEDYAVSLTFDEVKSNGQAKLLVYDFGGYSFKEGMIADQLNVKANVIMNAEVGKVYTCPKAKAISLYDGLLPQSAVSISVYDEEGHVVNGDGSYSFTPAKEGAYYLYYKAEHKGLSRYQSYKISALVSSTNKFIFETGKDLNANISLGLHESLYIPKANVVSSLSHASEPLPASMTIYKDGTPISGYQDVAGGFEYEFTSVGDYSIVYGCPLMPSLTSTRNVVVSAENVGIKIGKMNDFYGLNASFSLPKATIYYKGEEIESSVTLFYPSGRSFKNKDALLNETGKYSLLYLYEYGGSVYSFSRHFYVGQENAKLWTGSSSRYKASAGNNLIKGVELDLKEQTKVIYSKPVDLKDNFFDDSVLNVGRFEKNTPLLSLYFEPQTAGKADMEALFVTLADVSDPDNAIQIRLRRPSWGNNGLLRAKGPNQIWVGYNYNPWDNVAGHTVEATQNHEDGAFVSSARFTGDPDSYGSPYEEGALILYWDNARNRLYARPQNVYEWNGSNWNHSLPTEWLVRDFSASSDSEDSAGDPPFQGFKTGVVNLSIYARSVTGESAKVLVQSVNGVSLADEFVKDEKGPDISILIPKKMPKALVGTEFRIFDYMAVDLDSRVLEKYVEVYLGSKFIGRKETFVPHKEGIYTIVYIVKDAFNNVSLKEVLVEAVLSLEAIKISLEGTLPSLRHVGETITIPTANATGGSGEVKIDVKAYCDEDEIPLIGNALFLEKKGSYKIVYKATDYVGQSVSETLTVGAVDYSNDPIMNESDVFLPQAFISGDTYCFYPYLAKLYSASKVEDVPCSIIVKDGDGEKRVGSDGLYTAKRSFSVRNATITFKFISGESSFSLTRVVPIVEAAPGRGYLLNYFRGEGLMGSIDDNGAKFKALSSNQDMKVSFLRAVNAKKFSLSFRADKLEEFHLSLTDKYNPQQKVTLDFKVLGGKTFVTNNGVTNLVSGANGVLTINYKGGHFYDLLDIAIANPRFYDNGKDFEGFSSNEAYFTIEGKSQNSQSAITVSSISNHTINSFRRDVTLPELHVHGTCSGRYSKGEAVMIHKAEAHDVISYVASPMVSISYNGKVLTNRKATEDFMFTPEEFGEYEVTYMATDDKGNLAKIVQFFSVVDKVKPTLEFKGELPSLVSVGDKISLPEYEIKDNGDLASAKVTIYLCGLSGEMTEVKDSSITLGEKGTYVLYYYVTDDMGNVNVYSFAIRAK